MENWEVQMETKKESFLIASLVLALGIAIAGFFIGSGIKYFKNFDRSVAVKGLSERVVKSDLATWNINFGDSDEDLKKLYSKITNDQKIIKEHLLNNGFKENEIQIGTLSTTDNWANAYANSINTPRYTISSTVTLITSDVDKVYNLSQSSGELVEKGVLVTFNMINYHFNGLNLIKEEMLNEATKNAKTAAETFAKNSNSNIGEIKSANQGVFSISSPDGSSEGESTTIMKKVRVVTSVDFFLK